MTSTAISAAGAAPKSSTADSSRRARNATPRRGSAFRDEPHEARAGGARHASPGANGAAIAAAVASNAIDVGYADLGSLAKAHARGVLFTIVAPAAMWVSSAPVNLLMVAKQSPIRTARDLAGKTIAVPILGTSTEPFLAQAKLSGRAIASADDALGKAYLRTVWFTNAA